MDKTEPITDSLTIYVRLLEEGVDVWRPVLAKNLGNGIFRIVSECDHDVEIWEFEEGTLVVVEPKELNDGTVMVAVRVAEDSA